MSIEFKKGDKIKIVSLEVGIVGLWYTGLLGKIGTIEHIESKNMLKYVNKYRVLINGTLCNFSNIHLEKIN